MARKPTKPAADPAKCLHGKALDGSLGECLQCRAIVERAKARLRGGRVDWGGSDGNDAA